MDEIRKAYEEYCDKAEAVKEVGKKILDLIEMNNNSIKRYAEARETEPDSDYYDSWAEELKTENEMLLELERYHRGRFLKDARHLYTDHQNEAGEVW